MRGGEHPGCDTQGFNGMHRACPFYKLIVGNLRNYTFFFSPYSFVLGEAAHCSNVYNLHMIVVGIH